MNERIIYLPPPMVSRLAEKLRTCSGPALIHCERGAVHVTRGGVTHKLGAQIPMPVRIEITDCPAMADALSRGYPMRVYGHEVRTGPGIPGVPVGRAYTPYVPSTETHPGTSFYLGTSMFTGYKLRGYLEAVCDESRFHAISYPGEISGWTLAPTWCRLAMEPVAAAGPERLAFLLDGSVALPGLRRVGVWSGASRKRSEW